MMSWTLKSRVTSIIFCFYLLFLGVSSISALKVLDHVAKDERDDQLAGTVAFMRNEVRNNSANISEKFESEIRHSINVKGRLASFVCVMLESETDTYKTVFAVAREEVNDRVRLSWCDISSAFSHLREVQPGRFHKVWGAVRGAVEDAWRKFSGTKQRDEIDFFTHKHVGKSQLEQWREAYAVYKNADGKSYALRAIGVEDVDIWSNQQNMQRERRNFTLLILAIAVATTTLVLAVLTWLICRTLNSFRKEAVAAESRLSEAANSLKKGNIVSQGILNSVASSELKYILGKVDILLHEASQARSEFLAMRQHLMSEAVEIGHCLSHDEVQDLEKFREMVKVVIESNSSDVRVKEIASVLDNETSVISENLKDIQRRLIDATLGEPSARISVDVEEIVYRVLENRKKHAPAEMIFREDIEELKCNTDQYGFARIMTNIVGNAVKYGRREVHISARLLQREMCVEIIVENDYTPLPKSPEEKLELLKWGRRARGLVRDAGSGVGLALAADWLENGGGSIDLGDSPLGGARVIIRVRVV